jgi:hypothetical protein
LKPYLDKLIADMEAMRIEVDTMALRRTKFIGFYSLLESIGDVVAASPKREWITEIIEGWADDCRDEPWPPSGPEAPALLRDLLTHIVEAVSREDDGA